MRGIGLLLVAACWPFPEPDSSYELQVCGATAVTARGRAEAGFTGNTAEPFYTITLGGPDGSAAVVFTWAGPASPPAGVYPVGEWDRRRNGFSGLIVTGMPAHPTGVFRVRSGTLTILTATSEQLTGRFKLTAVGFLTESPGWDDRTVTAAGGFTVGGAGFDSASTPLPACGP